MKPLGRKPIRFPGKIDCHPKKGYANWWEVEVNQADRRKSERQQTRRDLLKWIK